MQFIQSLEALIQSGVTFSLKLAAAGENVRLDIVATGKSTKTGVALPSKALIGTGKELDDALAEFLPKYAASTTRIHDVLASADSDLAAAEREATETARKAVEEKSRSKSNPGVKSAGKAAPPAKRDLSAGMLAGGDDSGGDDNDGGEGGDDTTLDASTADAPTSPQSPATAE
jgi:PRTRC genetic system protein E